MNPKSVLMIAYYFPPDGCAAVYRPLRFLKALVKKGWHVIVLCCHPYQYEREDPQLLDQVPIGTSVVRVAGRDLWCAFQTWRGVRIEHKLTSSSLEEAQQVVARQYSAWRSRFRELIRKIEACVYRPDLAMPWIHPATREAIGVCQANRPNVIWATIGPISAGIVAYRTSLATGIPYVLDFRDPWGLDYYPEEIRRPAWARKKDQEAIAAMFKQAQAVVFMFESIAEQYVRTFPDALIWRKIHIIPNGFDGTVDAFAHAPGARCTVLYAGTLRSYRYDTLLEGLARLKSRNAVPVSQLRLLFVGEQDPQLGDRVEEMGLSEIVEIAPPVSSGEVRRLQEEAHALLILGRTATRKGHELVAGAKLFGYLQAGRPIIGVVPHDETRRILEQVGSSLIAAADAPEEVADKFELLLKAWSDKTLDRLIPDRAACESYSSGKQISALVDALDGRPREYQ